MGPKVEFSVTVWYLNVWEQGTKGEPMGVIYFGFWKVLGKLQAKQFTRR